MSKWKRRRVRRQGIPKRWAQDSIQTGVHTDWRGARPKPSPDPLPVVNIISKERLAVLHRRDQILAKTNIAYDSHIVMEPKNLKLFFNDKQNQWFFIEEHTELTKKSVVYNSRQRAMMAYQWGINWFEVFKTSE